MSPRQTARPYLAVALAIALLSPAAAFAQDTAPQRSITVSGTGEVSAPPDLAELNVGVTTQGKTAKEALDANNAAMQKLMDSVKAAGIADKDMQTSNFSVSPRYQSSRMYSDPTGLISGYDVSNTLGVTVRELDKLGTILDAFVGDGANTLYGIQFGFADPEALLNEARKKAIEHARTKAKLYAQTALVSVGTVLNIQESGAAIPRPMMGRMAMAESAASVPIAGGENTVSASVQVTFAID